MSDAIKELHSKFHNLVMKCDELKAQRRIRPVVVLDNGIKLQDDAYNDMLHEIILTAPLCCLNELGDIDDHQRGQLAHFGITISKPSKNMFALSHKNVVINFQG